MELSKEHYNKGYKGAKKYECHFTESPYFEIWQHVVSIINPDSKVLDLGCGTGQFANMLIDNDINLSYGVDFSTTAINMANKVVEGNFYQGDLYDKAIYDKHEYDTVVCLEVLEHINRDLEVLSNISKGTNIIITVPSYDSIGHVRHFNNINSVISRYKDSFNIIGSKTFEVSDKNKIFLLYGNN